MPTHPLVLKGKVWQDGRLSTGAIGIDPASGRITAVGADLEGDEVQDLGARWILPGGIDIHVHFRDPGHPHKEDFASGTESALRGGTTTVFDMPNTEPATTTAEAYQAKCGIAAAKAHCDWGIYGGATRPGETLRRLAPHIPALKIYLGESTGCVTLEEPELLPAVLDDLEAVGYTGIVVFHAEAKHVLAEAGAAHRDAPGLPGHSMRRPVTGEAAALGQIEAAMRDRDPRFRVHIAHVSAPELIDRIRAPGWSFGVTPNHLYLHHDMDLGAQGRMNPPLRRPQDQAGLFAALVRGIVPIVESDHAPHTLEEKARDVREAPSGIPGVGTLRPLLLSSVVDGRLPLDVAMAVTAERPADLFGLRKGRIVPGHDADLAIYDPGMRKTIRAEMLGSRAGWTPHEGSPGLFPIQVYVRGHLALDDDRLLAKRGSGREARRGFGAEATP